jgi:valyl-tRNA synthetase
MIMAGLEFMEEVPFKNVLLNGIVRDERGKKMSKSLGNGIDPLEMVEQFSADAVRFTLIMLSSEGQDINLSTKNFEMGRNFSNKIWNAYRFLSMHINKIDTDFEKYQDHFELADKWILSSFQKTIEETESNLNRFRVNESLNVIYQFFWHNYCDWYLELIKKRLYADDSDTRKAALSIAAYIMKETMSIMHPFIPFLTEEVWQAFKNRKDESIVIHPWPKVLPDYLNDSAEKEMTFIQSLIGAIRNIRAEMNVPPGKNAPLYVRSNDTTMDIIKRDKEYFSSLAKVEEILPFSSDLQETVTATAVVEGTELFIPLADLIDIDKEKARLQKEIQRLQGLEKSISGKLSNQNFISKAPEVVVTTEKDKLAKIQESLEKVIKNYDKLV